MKPAGVLVTGLWVRDLKCRGEGPVAPEILLEVDGKWHVFATSDEVKQMSMIKNVYPERFTKDTLDEVTENVKEWHQHS